MATLHLSDLERRKKSRKPNTANVSLEGIKLGFNKVSRKICCSCESWGLVSPKEP